MLEDRLVPSNLTAANAADLIADIKTANQAGGSNTITLVAGDTFTLTQVNNKTDGNTGLPVITANDNLTIIGNGDTIERRVANTPDFRLFDVASGASLTLQTLSLQGGTAYGNAVSADGGAIYSQGTLDLSGVTVQDNGALGKNGEHGNPSQSACGGGMYSSGVLTLESGCVIQDNSAIGGGGTTADGVSSGAGSGGGLYVAGGTAAVVDTIVAANYAEGGAASAKQGTVGGRGSGGGLYVAGGTVTLTGDTLSSNFAQGGDDRLSSGGMGFGGGLFAAGGTITMRDDSVTGNGAEGGIQKYPEVGNALSGGGGIAINAFTITQATVYLDAFTAANTINNTPFDIYNSYTLIS
jgi:hypothetical protein